MIDPRIWEDQAEFNRQLRPQLPEAPAQQIALLKEFALHLITEVTELLEAANAFGAHRRPDDPKLINPENIRRQLIDIEKYWISICQAFRFTPEQMEETYWRKSATVRQRYAEEWLTSFTGPVVVLDLDGVLADYLQGIFQFMIDGYMVDGIWKTYENHRKLDEIEQKRLFVNAESLGMSVREWELLNHEFRATGGFRTLPLMPGAKEFVDWCQEQYHVVALTSRPVDQYPNIYDDTVAWFAKHQIKIDKIWWGPNKAEKLAAVMQHMPEVKFAVDDDPKYVLQLMQCKVPRVYWYRHGRYDDATGPGRPIWSLDMIIKEETTP